MKLSLARLGLRGQLFLAMVALSLGGLLATLLYFQVETNAQLHRRWVDDLRRSAAAAVVAAQDDPPSDVAAFDELANRLGVAFDARVTFIANDGAVIGDSAIAYSDLATTPNHRTRPEIADAFATGSGSRRRYSATLREELEYVATSFAAADGSMAIARVARSPGALEGDAADFTRAMVLAFFVVMAIAALLAAWLASLLSRRLRDLVRQTSPTVGGGDEIAGLAGSFDRLGERLQANVSALEAERQRFSAVVESLGEAVVAVDEHGRITAANGAAKRLLEITRPPEGERLLEVVRIPTLQSLVDGALEGMHETREVSLDAPARTVLVVTSPMANGAGAVLVLRDVTEIRRLETIRTDFVANVSHELRTPVSIIQASAETLASLAADGISEPRFVEKIQRNAARMGHIIDDLLALSRAEAGHARLRTQRVDVAAMLDNVVASMREAAAARRVHIETTVELGLEALADANALEQVVLNLVDNAVKYGPESAPLNVRAARVDDSVEICVEDAGPGISAEHRARVFERFYRVDAGQSRDMGGTGLGLAIVKHLAEAMGGSVRVEPRAPKGARFVVTLPRPADG